MPAEDIQQKGEHFDSIESEKKWKVIFPPVKEQNCLDQAVISKCRSPPSCLVRNDACWNYCELSTFCVKIGRCGHPLGEKYRKPIMYFASFLSFVSLILGAIAVIGAGTEASYISNFPWSFGYVNVNSVIDNTTNMALKLRHGIDFEGKKIKVYIGLNAAVVDGSALLSEEVQAALATFNPKNLTESQLLRYNHLSEEGLADVFKRRPVLWKDQRCNLQYFSGQLCKECADLAISSTSFAFMALVTTIPQLQTDLLRAHACNDIRCQKAFGMFTGVWGLFSNLMTLQQFYLVCKVQFDKLPNVTWNTGIGLAAIAVATFLKIFDVLCHAFVPVPKNVEDMAHYNLGRP